MPYVSEYSFSQFTSVFFSQKLGVEIDEQGKDSIRIYQLWKAGVNDNSGNEPPPLPGFYPDRRFPA